MVDLSTIANCECHYQVGLNTMKSHGKPPFSHGFPMVFASPFVQSLSSEMMSGAEGDVGSIILDTGSLHGRAIFGVHF